MAVDLIKGSTVFVPGGAGFVGSALVRALLDLDCTVIVIDNCLHGSMENIQDLGPRCIAIKGDVLDVDLVDATFEKYGPDFVINCIGDTYVPDAYDFPLRMVETNILTILNLLMATLKYPVKRFVHVSTTEVYGITPQERMDEKTPFNPVNTYAVTKLAGDRLCSTFHIEKQVPVVIARLFNSYGPRATHPYVIPEIIHQFSHGSQLHLGNLEARRDWTYVDDTALALVALLTADFPLGEAVNVGSGNLIGLRPLIDAIATEMGIEKPEIIVEEARMRKLDIDSFCCDNSLLVRTTGWAPRIPIAEGLKSTILWFNEHGKRWPWHHAS